MIGLNSVPFSASPHSPQFRQLQFAKLYAGRLHPPYATLPKRRPGSPPGRRFSLYYRNQQQPVRLRLSLQIIGALDIRNR